MGLPVFHSIAELQASSEEALFRSVAIGNLDGIHRGHQHLVESAVKTAEAHGGVPAVLTFSPHPQEVLHPSTEGHRLTTDAEKFALLAQSGVRLILALRFDRDLAEMPPEAFFETYLRNGLRAGSVHVGFDFHFGRKRSGNVELLRACGAQAGIQVDVIPAVLADNGTRISSSAIRLLVQQGRVAQAASYLGRPYSLSGGVVHGAGRGKQLGTPTANIDYCSDKIAPRFGVYATRLWWKGRSFASVTNFGRRPTFEAAPGKPALETHVLDFSESLYGETVALEFLEWVREEKRFDGVDALRSQIQADIATVRKLKIIPG